MGLGYPQTYNPCSATMREDVRALASPPEPNYHVDPPNQAIGATTDTAASAADLKFTPAKLSLVASLHYFEPYCRSRVVDRSSKLSSCADSVDFQALAWGF